MRSREWKYLSEDTHVICEEYKFFILLQQIQNVLKILSTKLGLMGCGTQAGYAYWFSYTLLNTWIILNLFFALLLSSIDEVSKLEASAVSRFMLKDLMNLWRNFDPDGHGFISYKDFWVFSSQVIVKFGLTGDDLRNLNNKKNFLKFMQIPVYRDIESNYFGYRFHDTIVTLCKTAVIIKYGAVE
jgi:hypothetical protein